MESPNLLVLDHLTIVGLIVSSACRRLPSHVRREDLTSAGHAGLVRAARDFDPSGGVPFEAYAAIRIRGALIDELRSMDWANRESVPATSPERDRGRDWPHRCRPRRARRRPQQASLLSLQGFTPDTADALLPSASDNPELALLNAEQSRHVQAAIAELPDRQRHIVQVYYFEHQSMASLAAELGVTESRISQLQTDAAKRLRCALHT